MMNVRCSDNDLSRRDIPSFIEPRPPLIQNPFMRPRPQKATNLLERFEEDDSEVEEPDLVQVYLRMKPCEVPNNLYEVRSDKCLVTSVDSTTAGHGRRTQHNVSRMYTFSRIFTADCTQKEIFENVVKDNLKKLMEGNSFTLLTYGASGSGKTYTLMGTVTSPGLIPRSLEYVFKLVDAAQMPMYKPCDNGAENLEYAHQEYELQWVKRLRQVSVPLRDKYRRMSAQLHNDLTISNIDLTTRTKHYVWVSFVEIYNEAIYDLLAPPDKRVKMRIREDASGNVYVKDLTQAFVRSGEEAYDVMVAGKHNLVVAATGVHAHSSRSHCIFTITLLTETEGEIRTSHVRLCDLAGCERARATRNTGARMQESRAINSSLHVLERCLHMLRRKQRLMKDSSLVPYRESKLTRLLGSGLSGSRGEAVSMVVTLNPSPQYAHETKHVLSLAAVAQDIQINNTMYASTLLTLESSTQDTTIHSSGELMRLRADNERLHYELAQAQSRNKELLGSMEKTQQETAKTMREIVDETKDMMRQYYEAQIKSLQLEMCEMKEEYESRLSKPQSESDGVGTPSRFLQNKVEQLMREITVLENQLSEEKLARARAEKEVQHLRDCIEERDDKAYKESSFVNQEVLDTSDSENENDDESRDLNESLEIVFKKERRSHILHNHQVSKLKLSKFTEESVDETIEKTVEEECTIDEHKSRVSIKPNTNSSRDVEWIYISIDNDCTIEEEIKQIKKSDSVEQLSVMIDDKDIRTKLSVTQDLVNCIEDKDKSECEELLNVSTVEVDVPDKDKNDSQSAVRGTYLYIHVQSVEVEQECLGDELKIAKQVNSLRGTYFMGQPSSMSLNSLEFEDDDIGKKVIKDDIADNPKSKIKPTKEMETVVNKIRKSLKTNQCSDNSLDQFEQLEMAANNINNSKDKSIDIVDLNVMRKKKNYFDDADNEIGQTAEKVDETNDSNIDVMKDNIPKTKTEPKRTYFEDNPYEKICSTSKMQEKALYFDDNDSALPPAVSFKIEDQSDNNAKSKSNCNMLSDATKIKEKIYFDDADKIKSNDVLISSSAMKRRPYFDDDVPVELAVNKQIKNIIVHSLKDQDRSPSIVKDDLHKDYEPSSAMKKLLGETVKNPEVLSSIHKKVAKKHESVDIFESPQVTVAKAKEVILGDTEIRTNKDNIVTNAHSFGILTKTKEVDSVINVQKNKQHINEGLVSTMNIKQEIKLELIPSIEEITNESSQSATVDLNCDLAEKSMLCNESRSLTSNQASSETQPSKDNNTIDEFEKIVKDLSNITTTQFDLLLNNEANVTKDQDKDKGQLIEPKDQKKVEFAQISEQAKEKNCIEITEKEKKFEDTKYNLRNKRKPTNHDTCEDKKGNEIEHILAASNCKSEKTTTKRSLRLKRQKNKVDENFDEDNERQLKDIINLKKEFSDVTLGLPAVKKEVKDIPSPEKLPGEEENVPPLLGTQSCPSKSVTRSRRKLFTPRAEPLEESPSHSGDSHERLRVPRPSYHRVRARRKL